MKIFGGVAYYHVREGKLDPRAKIGCFVGYGDGVKGFKIYSPLEGRVILSRDVTFDESTMYSKKSTESPELGKEGENLLQIDVVLEVHQSSIVDLPLEQFIDDDAEVPVSSTPEPEVVPSSPNSGEEVEQSNQGLSSQSNTILERPRQVIKKPVRLIEEMEGRKSFVENLTGYALSVADDVESYEPATYKQAISCSESVQWQLQWVKRCNLFTRTECGNL